MIAGYAVSGITPLGIVFLVLGVAAIVFIIRVFRRAK